MRILHTSDWHIGRTFHGHSTLDALRGVLDALVAQVRDQGVDVVIVAGDVFDSATPAAACYADVPGWDGRACGSGVPPAASAASAGARARVSNPAGIGPRGTKGGALWPRPFFMRSECCYL